MSHKIIHSLEETVSESTAKVTSSSLKHDLNATDVNADPKMIEQSNDTNFSCSTTNEISTKPSTMNEVPPIAEFFLSSSQKKEKKNLLDRKQLLRESKETSDLIAKFYGNRSGSQLNPFFLPRSVTNHEGNTVKEENLVHIHAAWPSEFNAHVRQLSSDARTGNYASSVNNEKECSPLFQPRSLDKCLYMLPYEDFDLCEMMAQQNIYKNDSLKMVKVGKGNSSYRVEVDAYDLIHWLDTIYAPGSLRSGACGRLWGLLCQSGNIEINQELISGSDWMSLWTQKYKPLKVSDVMGTGPHLEYLIEWLQKWKVPAQNAQPAPATESGPESAFPQGSKKRKMDAKRKFNRNKRNQNFSSNDDFIVSDTSSEGDFEYNDYFLNYSDLEMVQEDTGLSDNHHILLIGPPGSCKTAAVYACAMEMGFEVLEVNASSKRSGKDLMSMIGGNAESHLVGGSWHQSSDNLVIKSM